MLQVDARGIHLYAFLAAGTYRKIAHKTAGRGLQRQRWYGCTGPSSRLTGMTAPSGVRTMYRTLQPFLIVVVACVLVACGQTQAPEPSPQPQPQLPQPLQSPIQTQLQSPIQPPSTLAPVDTGATSVPPATPGLPASPVTSAPTAAIVAATGAATTGPVSPVATTQPAPPQPTSPTAALTLPAVGNGTPDTRATSRAVILTLTAAAAPPTSGPTRTPTKAVKVGAGGRARVTRVPTPTSDPSGVTLLALSNHVYRGGAISLSIRTKPGVACQIKAIHTEVDGTTTDLALSHTTGKTGSDGVVAWIWPVDAAVPAGPLVLRAECGQTGEVHYNVEVVN